MATALLTGAVGAALTKGTEWLIKNPERAVGYASNALNTVKTVGGIPLKWLGRKARNAFSRTHGWYRKFNKTDEEKELIDKEVEEEIEERETKAKREPGTMEQIKTAIAGDIVENRVNEFLGIDPGAEDAAIRKIGQQAQVLNKYAGGSAMSKVAKSIRDAQPGQWRDIDWKNMTGAAAELFGKMDSTTKGSTWNPVIGAGLNAAKTFLKASPVLGAAIDIGGLLATSQTARDVAGWVGDKVKDLGKYAYSKLTGNELALQHNEDVIPILKSKKKSRENTKETKKEKTIEQRPRDDSGTNIPNLIPQESNAEYMMRMTGGMNVGPDNANVPTYSGHRKPQYEKVDNRVMMAPPQIAADVVKEVKKLRKKVKRLKKKVRKNQEPTV